MTRKTICYGVAVAIATLLIVGLTFAQSSQPTTARKSVSIIVLDKNSSTAPREAGSGMSTGRRQHEPTMQTVDSNNSAHATESMSTQRSGAQGTNPLYEGSGKSGTNPMYNPKEYQPQKDSAIKPNSAPNSPATNFKQDFGQVQASKKEISASPNGQSAQGGSSNTQSGNSAAAQQKTYRPGRQKPGNIEVTR